MIVDYHMHLRGQRAGDSEPLTPSLDTVQPFVERALERGVDEIAFTEHVYYFTQTREIWTLPYQLDRCAFDLDVYCEVIGRAKDRGLPVKLGLEVDYVGGRQERLAELLDGYPWDLLLGSIHWLGDLSVDESASAENGVWQSLGVEEIWRAYFDAVCDLADGGLVDVLAHPDLVKIFDIRPGRAIEEELYESAAATIGRSGVAVEVSTAGLRKPVAELYPDPYFLAACAREGVPVTLASDAHQPELVGEDYEAALQLLRATGISDVAVFTARDRRLQALPS